MPLYILIAHSNTTSLARADYSELGGRKPGLRTARRERRTRLDTLAGGRQAAFGKEAWMKGKDERGRMEQGKRKRDRKKI